MGDSANFKYVLHEVGDPFTSARQSRFWGDNLQKSLLERLDRSTHSTIQTLHAEEADHLRNAGAFDLPRKDISDALLDVFLTLSFPAFPIFVWNDFMGKYRSGSVSLLLLNAVYMMATFHCPESLLYDAGLASRYIASLTFYRRAKALYDADYESDGISIVQTTLLLSNWWGGPMEQKDTWYWLGAAAGLAQSLGMHRSKSYDLLPTASQRAWRRTWWVLYINDIHHAAVYGRPPHIHSSFHDISSLQEDDFDASSPEGSAESRLYLVHLADLISREPNTETNWTSYEKLLQWKNTLPVQFKNIPSQITIETGFWPALIHLYYWDYKIVFYRMFSDTPITAGLASPLFDAAAQISHLLEDLVTSGILYNAPFLILPAIFASIIVHVTNICKGDSNLRVISEHRARLAMHILDRFQDTWPIAIWTRYLLDGLLRLSTGHGHGHGQPLESDNRDAEISLVSTAPAPAPALYLPGTQKVPRFPMAIVIP
ncbi:fungal-specific transcription factor domain-containing protein [Aspergillus cavernicola]|uniref:Fungal-specific transcription factor domain-containing protein n=1 Tax=Aspergillus cavernicola TaxID=176166 RepID=A0ABR4I7L3_9EURO